MLRTLDRMLKSPWVAAGIIVVFVAGVAFGLPDSDEATAQEIPASQPPDLDKLVIPEDVTPIPVTVIREVTGGPAKTTKAYAEYKAAPPGRALYFRELDRVYHLPDDVRIKEYIMSISCQPGSFCPRPIVTVLERGSAEIGIEKDGNILWDLASPEEREAFRFLEVTDGPAKLSKSYAEYKAAPRGRALYFRELDRVLHLPDDVHLRGMIITGMCAASDCPELPIYVLVNGESTISLDRYGNVIPGFYKETYDADAFPFLTQGN